jgi:hypothetical protein
MWIVYKNRLKDGRTKISWESSDYVSFVVMVELFGDYQEGFYKLRYKRKFTDYHRSHDKYFRWIGMLVYLGDIEVDRGD